MRRILQASAMVVLALLWMADGLWAAEVEKSAEAAVGIFSNYVWRGQKLSEEAVVQPTAGLNYGGFGANLWLNYDTDLEEATETDVTLNYGISIEKLSLEAGYIYYALDSVADTQEFYMTVGYEMPLNPSLTFYYDFDEGTGGYLVLALSQDFPLMDKLTLNLGASAGVNFENAILGTDSQGDEFTGFYNGEIKASLTYALTENLTVEPVVAYSFPLSDDAETAIEGLSYDGDSDIFYGGVNVTLSF